MSDPAFTPKAVKGNRAFWAERGAGFPFLAAAPVASVRPDRMPGFKGYVSVASALEGWRFYGFTTNAERQRFCREYGARPQV